MARTKAQRDTEQELTNGIIDLIENGMVEGKWVRPWKTVGFLPFNASTGNQYRGINMLLGIIMGGGAFATYKQWQELGGQVRAGEKAVMMFRPLTIQRKDNAGNVQTDANGNPDTFMLFKAFASFASHQQDGWAPESVSAPTFNDVDGAEALINATGAVVKHGGSDKAFYAPGSDVIQMPDRAQFTTAAGYYGTMLHELVHWTGHSSRLDRELNTNRFGDDAYAFEELVAELGATFLCAHFGIEQEEDANHVKYIKGWLNIMKGDKRAIRDAASKAQKAVDFIMEAMVEQEDAQAA